MSQTVAELRAGQSIIDAHHHVWDLSLGKHSWLINEPQIPFRYGDYRAMRRTYMPADFRRDSAGFKVVKSVYVEAEWDPKDPVGETRWIHDVAAREGLPNAVVAQAWLDRDDASAVLARQAAFALVRSVRHKPKSALRPADAMRGAPGSMDDPKWRAGFAQLQRHGLHFDLQTAWWHFDAAADLARDFPGIQIIVITPGCRRTAARKGWPVGAARWNCWRAGPTSP